jgi:hypothetical protein
VILLPVLTVLTSCTSTEPIEPERPDYREVLKAMIPTLPEIPSMPELTWTFKDGLYCITESDADKLLDYGENRITLFRYEIDLYKRQLDIVLKQL